jgi:3-oxoacyl-(acyl-carrier-protein) synthase
LVDRIVVTGLGAVTPVGLTAGETWENLRAGRSGVGEIISFDASHLSVKFDAEVTDFDPSGYVDNIDAANGLGSCYGMAAAAERPARATIEWSCVGIVVRTRWARPALRNLASIRDWITRDSLRQAVTAGPQFCHRLAWYGAYARKRVQGRVRSVGS